MNSKQLALDEERELKLKHLLLLGGGAAMMATAAIAGTDTTFDTATNQVSGWIEGSLGKLVTMSSVAVAIVNIVTQFNWKVIGGALAVGVAAGLGPDIVGGMVTGTF